MIKLVLLSGFLGAGKTTLMKEILNTYGNLKTGIIVNEFGEINIDAKLIRKDGIQMAELSNGSIFCACIKDKFVDSLIEMSLKDLDYLFIEASGLADPANMEHILDGVKNKLLNSYDYKGSVCIVDGESFANLFELLPAIRNQLEFCGSVIINKGDLINEGQLEEIMEIIQDVNPSAGTFVTSYCKVDIKELIEGLNKPVLSGRDSSNTYESQPTTFILKGLGTVPLENISSFLKEVAPSTYRIKGFANTEKGTKEISAVGKHIYINDWSGDIVETEIVVISSISFRIMSVLTKAIENNGLKGIIRL